MAAPRCCTQTARRAVALGAGPCRARYERTRRSPCARSDRRNPRGAAKRRAVENTPSRSGQRVSFMLQLFQQTVRRRCFGFTWRVLYAEILDHAVLDHHAVAFGAGAKAVAG